ncbi:probable aluminum-activated malate transporter 5 at N-terminal half [Coccomyxa sp. Obi]|nr:probable aluminum-activated malate transporter 5 at N-terminal half [Coccomyxa sp. Obi]
MGLGVFLTIFIAYCVVNYKLLGDGPQGEHIAKLVGDAARAAGITCVVVASPVVGKVLVVGLDRTIGTVFGGVCGWLSFLVAHKIWNGEYLPTYATLSILTFVAAFGSVVIAWRLAKLETTPKLFTLTFILVALGSSDPKSDLEVMVSRILGIVCGSFTSLLVALFVYPISATEAVLESIKRALQGLSHLNAAAISEGKQALGHARDAQRQMDEEAGLQAPLLSFQEAASHSQACEEALMQVVVALQSAHEMLPLSQNEAYVGTYFGRMWFLPGLVWCGFKHIPKEQIKAPQDVLTDIRCTAWLMWRIHMAFRQMAFRQGMGAHFALVLTKMLPPDIVQRLASTSQEAIDCLVNTFPAVPPTTPGLDKFKQTVSELMKITQRQHRQLLHCMRSEQGYTFHPVPNNTAGQESKDFNQLKQAARATYQGNVKGSSARNGAGSDGEPGSPSAEQRLWDAARTEIHLPMPQSDLGAERDIMAAEGASSTSYAPGDSAAVPACAEDQVAEVRWYTFQFLMEELAEALECLHLKLHRLSMGLPDPAIQVECRSNDPGKGLL